MTQFTGILAVLMENMDQLAQHTGARLVVQLHPSRLKQVFNKVLALLLLLPQHFLLSPRDALALGREGIQPY